MAYGQALCAVAMNADPLGRSLALDALGRIAVEHLDIRDLDVIAEYKDAIAAVDVDPYIFQRHVIVRDPDGIAALHPNVQITDNLSVAGRLHHGRGTGQHDRCSAAILNRGLLANEIAGHKGIVLNTERLG